MKATRLVPIFICLFITALWCGRAVADGGENGDHEGNGNGTSPGNGAGGSGNNGGSNRGNNGGHQQFQPVPTAGSYRVKVVGSWNGTGDSLVTDTAVSFSVPVTDCSGDGGNFTANNLIISGDHFSGTGTICGVTVAISGRLDQVANARLVATIVCTDGRVSRAVGISNGAAAQGDPFGPGN